MIESGAGPALPEPRTETGWSEVREGTETIPQIEVEIAEKMNLTHPGTD